MSQARAMLGIRNYGSRVGLVISVLAVVTVAAVTDSTLRALGWNQPPGEIWPDFAPRGGVIGAIWVVLFAGMGAARWLVARSPRSGAPVRAQWIVGLIAACLAYPFYTHFVRGHATELIGNIVSFALATAIAVRIRNDSPLASALIALVGAWIVFATILVFALVRLNGWATA